MKFIFKNEINSTQIFLQDLVKNNFKDNVIVLSARNQNCGIGSRNNSWEKVESGLYFSFAIRKDLLPKDLPTQSSSIYFGQIFLDIFRKFNKDLILKWPNDFYLDSKKIGGVMSNNLKDYLIVGIGLNIYSENLASLLSIKNKKNLESTFANLQKSILSFFGFRAQFIESKLLNNFEIYEKREFFKIRDELSWSNIFQSFSVEFYRNRNFSANFGDKKLSFKYALLNDDGSVVINNKTFYSLR